jgi:hypothetical protein
MLGNFTCIQCHRLASGLAVASPPGQHWLTDKTAATQEMFKVVQLRNLYDKEGFTTASNKSRSGFGFGHDGSVDTLERFVSQDMFALKTDQDVADTVAFLLSFSGSASSVAESRGRYYAPSDSESHSLVGTQVVLYPEESRTVRKEKLESITKIARLGDIEVVARISAENYPPAMVFRPDEREFTNHDGTEKVADLSEIDGIVVLTVVHLGQAQRIAFDMDGDFIADAQEERDLFPEISGINNPFNSLWV